MAYIGVQPTDTYLSIASQQITGTGSATYTLDYSVSNEEDVAVFVNNVRQNVSSYTVSGNQLTLGGTISASDECWVLFLGRTVGTKTPAVGSVTNDMLSSGSFSNITGTGTLTNFTSTGIDDNATSNALTLDSSANLQFNSGYGSVATAYGVRAWVNYDGRVSVGIRNSGNVSSVTDTATGDYTINFINAMPDVNYSITSANATYLLSTTDYRWFSFVTSVSTSSFRVKTNIVQNGTSTTDSEYVSHVVFR